MIILTKIYLGRDHPGSLVPDTSLFRITYTPSALCITVLSFLSDIRQGTEKKEKVMKKDQDFRRRA